MSRLYYLGIAAGMGVVIGCLASGAWESSRGDEICLAAFVWALGWLAVASTRRCDRETARRKELETQVLNMTGIPE